MKIHTIDTGLFKLDGGAMFGVVPKSMWENMYPPDTGNMCTWAMRSLLVEDGNRLLLVDTGAGTKQDAKFRRHFFLENEGVLENSLRRLGFTSADITDVFLTHLHFDHSGGAVQRAADGTLGLTFPNATYWSNEAHWNWAAAPNPREKASFLAENLRPIQESGHLKFVGRDGAAADVLPQFRDVLMHDGHTEKMMVPVLEYKGRTLAFVSDLMPSAAHIPLPYVMSYDMRPLVTMTEKETLLRRAADENWVLIFQHDHGTEAGTVQHTDRGVRLAETLRLADL